MKGVAYQQGTGAAGTTSEQTTKYVDPLADDKACERDVPLLQELGTNIVRAYAIDPTADHDACMKRLDEAGIYVIADLSEPALSINRDSPQWNTELQKRYNAVVDALGKYSNTVGFFAGNEVSNNKSNTDASAFVKAAVRDTKAYIQGRMKKDKNARWMGVGYAANDDVDIRKDIADYFNCDKPEDAIDFWGYNIYSWCGKSNMKASGYSQQAQFFEGYSVPIFFAEYGCNLPNGGSGRIFDETTALYEDEMTKVFSGGIVYMYFQEENDYGKPPVVSRRHLLTSLGLVKVNGDKAVKQKDFAALQKKATAAMPKGVDRDSYNPTNKPQQCPDAKSSSWKANSALPPTPDQSLCDCMAKSRSCVKTKNLSVKEYGSIFGFICGEAPEICSGIRANATTGIYGAYSMCPDGDKLDYVLDAYYVKMNKNPSACDFKGKADTQSGSAPSSCSDKLAKASDINRQVATATAPVGGGGATATSDSFAVPGAPMARLVSVGDFAMGLYMAVALVVGAAMVAL